MMDPVSVQLRRRKLYGAKERNEPIDQLKKTLTRDHVKDLRNAQNDHSTSSITKSTYKGSKKEGQEVPVWTLLTQNETHFDHAPDTQNNAYKSSTTSKDFDRKYLEKYTAKKPENTINLPDFAPKYWADNNMGNSMYNSSYSKESQAFDPELRRSMESSEKMRKFYLTDLQSTHFSMGNDPSMLQTETYQSYFSPRAQPTSAPAAGMTSTSQPVGADPKQFGRMMKMEEWSSSVFRRGDYNMNKSAPLRTTIQRDYKNRLKSARQAAVNAPTPDLLNPDEEEMFEKLQQQLMKRDKIKMGFMKVEDLLECCQDELTPWPLGQLSLQDILQKCRQAEGRLYYNDFLQVLKDCVKVENKAKGQTKSDKERRAEALKLIQTDNEDYGKTYHTNAHFKLGTDREGLGSVYGAHFVPKATGSRDAAVIQQPSRIIPKPSVSGPAETSTKFHDYVDYSKLMPNTIKEMTFARRKEVKDNYNKLSQGSIPIGTEAEGNREDRQRSLSHSNFITPPETQRITLQAAPDTMYRFLASSGQEGELPQRSEAARAYVDSYGSSGGGGSQLLLQRLKSGKDQCRERLRQSYRTHFSLGSHSGQRGTEASQQFSPRKPADDLPAAGIKNNLDNPNISHMKYSENVNEGSGRPELFILNQQEPSDDTRSLERQLSNRDPRLLDLRKALLNRDPEVTGKMERSQVEDVFRSINLKVDSGILGSLLQSCDRGGKGTVDYHDLLTRISLQTDLSPFHTLSMTKKDYGQPTTTGFTQQQRLTIQHMDKKQSSKDAMKSHYFHQDHSADQQMASTSSQDFIQPELMPDKSTVPILQA